MKCQYCSAVLTSEGNKFCNNSCAASFNNRNRVKTFIHCLQCNAQIRVYPNQIKTRKFCSSKCSGEYRAAQIQSHHDSLIVKGLPVSENIESNNFIYKKYLIRQYGERCMKCSWSETNPFTGTIPIEMNHKDGNCTNNALSNLELLCPNCHSLTSTHKGANKGLVKSPRYEMWKQYIKNGSDGQIRTDDV